MSDNPQPEIRLERRPSDFVGRSVILSQAGSTTTCCTCCLHWLGAAAGGIYGVTRGFRTQPHEPPLAAGVRERLFKTTLYSLATTAGVLFIIVVGLHDNPVLQRLVLSLALLPSLFFIPVGAVILLVGKWLTPAAAITDDDQRLHDHERPTLPLTLAGRVTWNMLLYATAGMVIGYLIMIIIGVVMSSLH